jgi:hypothetical protein
LTIGRESLPARYLQFSWRQVQSSQGSFVTLTLLKNKLPTAESAKFAELSLNFLCALCVLGGE